MDNFVNLRLLINVASILYQEIHLLVTYIKPSSMPCRLTDAKGIIINAIDMIITKNEAERKQNR